MRIKITLLSICGLSFALRVAFQVGKVFTPTGVLFQGNDPYYHIRLAHYMAENWPRHMALEPWFYPPYNSPQVPNFVAPGLTWFIVGVSKLTGIEVNIIAAWLPPIIGSLIIIPVYFLGKELAGRFVGIGAAFLVSILPSEFFHRSMLGFADHHVLETLFSTTLLLSTVIILKGKRWGWIGFSISSICLTLSWNFGPAIIALVGLAAITAWLYTLKLKPAYIVMSIMLGLSAFMFYKTGMMDVVVNFMALDNQETAPYNMLLLFLNFGIALPASIAGMINAPKDKQAKVFFLLWGMAITIAMLGQRRWSYYATIPIAIYAAYFVQWLASRSWKPQYAAALAITVLMLSVGILPATFTLANKPIMIQPKWVQTLYWIRNNTEAANPDKADYWVLAFNDYGYWIITLAERPPINLPGDLGSGFNYIYYMNHEKGLEEMRNLNIRYLITDFRLLEKNPSLSASSLAITLYFNQIAEGFDLLYQEEDVKVWRIKL